MRRWFKSVLKFFIFGFLILSCSNGHAQNQNSNRDEVIENELQAAIERFDLDGSDQSQEKFREFEKKAETFELSTDEFGHEVKAVELELLEQEDISQEEYLQKEDENERELPPLEFTDNPLEIVPEPPIATDTRSRLKKIEVALEVASHNYRADKNYNGEKFEKNGALYGFYASYTYHRPYKNPVHSWGDLSRAVDGPGEFPTFMRMEGDVTFGQVNYDSFSTGRRTGYTAWQGNIRMLGGYDFLSLDSSLMITPYTGIGFRRFSDKAGGWIDHHINDYVEYENVYNYIYVPIGIETLKHFGDSWDLGVKLEGSVLLGGTVDYNLSDISGLYDGVDVNTGLPIQFNHRDSAVTLRTGFGLRASMKFIKKFDRFNYFTEPFAEYWKLTKSKSKKIISHATNGLDYESIADPLFEPENYTLQVGMRFGVQF